MAGFLWGRNREMSAKLYKTSTNRKLLKKELLLIEKQAKKRFKRKKQIIMWRYLPTHQLRPSSNPQLGELTSEIGSRRRLLLNIQGKVNKTNTINIELTQVAKPYEYLGNLMGLTSMKFRICRPKSLKRWRQSNRPLRLKRCLSEG